MFKTFMAVLRFMLDLIFVFLSLGATYFIMINEIIQGLALMLVTGIFLILTKIYIK